MIGTESNPPLNEVRFLRGFGAPIRSNIKIDLFPRRTSQKLYSFWRTLEIGMLANKEKFSFSEFPGDI